MILMALNDNVPENVMKEKSSAMPKAMQAAKLALAHCHCTIKKHWPDIFFRVPVNQLFDYSNNIKRPWLDGKCGGRCCDSPAARPYQVSVCKVYLCIETAG